MHALTIKNENDGRCCTKLRHPCILKVSKCLPFLFHAMHSSSSTSLLPNLLSNVTPSFLLYPFQDESPFVQVVPALSGIVSPVPSVHFQVHEPPTSQNDFCEECYNINEASVKSSLKSPLKRRNKTHPLMDQPNLESSDEIWYTHESRNKISVVGLLHRMSGKKMVSNTMKRAKGYWSDLDRIEVASPLAANDAPEKRRHSLVLHQWMQAWQNLNGCENRRLLPDCENGVHIMDGVSHRYYIGIIDIFTEYTIKQKIGRIFKSLIFCSSNHSSVPPDEYATRFVDFIEEHLVH